MPVIDGNNYTQLDYLNVKNELRVDGEAIGAKVLLNAASQAVDQQPAATDTPLQVEFGPPTITDKIEIDAAGNILFKVDQSFLFNLWIQVGRTGAAGISIIFIRVLLNGQNIPLVPPFVAELDNANAIVTDQYRGNFSVNTGDVMTIEIVRDSAGNNSGGLISATPTLPDWPFAPSARILISEVGVGDDTN